MLRRPRGGLWSHADFLKLWTGQTISEFGSQVSQLAIPWVALVTLNASAFEVAALGTVEFLPFVLNEPGVVADLAGPTRGEP